MSNRVNAFDYVRVIAVFMILLCHYFLFSDLNSGIGRYLGLTGNIIFFLISALLYSLKKQSGSIVIGGGYIDFLLKRVKRLGVSVWPFLCIFTILYLIFDIKFSWTNMGLNFIFLGYIGKIPGNEHLWFLTVLMACYVEIMVLTKYKTNNPLFPWLLLILMYLLMLISEFCGIPGHTFGIMGLFGLIFLKGEQFMKSAKAMKGWFSFLLIVLNMAHLYLCYHGLFEYSRILAFLFSDICGVALLALMVRYLPSSDNRVISFLSGISFEIYLVHHSFCAGPFVRITNWPNNHMFNFLILLIVSISLGYVLHLVSNYCSSVLIKRNN